MQVTRPAQVRAVSTATGRLFVIEIVTCTTVAMLHICGGIGFKKIDQYEAIILRFYSLYACK